MPKSRRGRPLSRPGGKPLQVGDILVARTPIGDKSYEYDFVQVIETGRTTVKVKGIGKKELPSPTGNCDLLFGDYMYNYCQPDPSTEPYELFDHQCKGTRWLLPDGRTDRRYKPQYAFKYCTLDTIVRDMFWEPFWEPDVT